MNATTIVGVPNRELTYGDVVSQINAEVGRVFKGNRSEFARAAGINRTQLIKYLDDGVDMGTMRLLHIIAVLGLSEGEFFKRARATAGIPETDA